MSNYSTINQFCEKPSVTTLSKLFGVSRQTLYNWGITQSMVDDWATGPDRTLEKAAKIVNLLKTSECLSQIFKRNLSGGKTFSDLVKDGASVFDAGKKLIHVVHTELEQREALEARLKARYSFVHYDECGSPMVEEDGSSKRKKSTTGRH